MFGFLLRIVFALPIVRVVYGYKPVNIDTLEAPQTGYWQCIFLNLTPRFARRSRFGVLHWGWPKPLRAVFKSSAIINSTFGCAAWVWLLLNRIVVIKKRFIEKHLKGNIVFHFEEKLKIYY